MEKEKLILPKGYISWSAMDTWERSRERFAREYFMQGTKLDTPALRFGKKIAEYLEELKEIEKGLTYEERPMAIEILKERHNLDDITAETIGRIESYDISEHKMVTTIGGVPVLSFIDSYDPVSGNFREYKTGKIPWTQAKVQKHGQLAFYAAALRTIVGDYPAYCHLDWIETTDTAEVTGDIETDFFAQNKKELRLTGNIKPFKREFDEREIDRMEERIIKAATEISEAYQKFIYDNI